MRVLKVLLFTLFLILAVWVQAEQKDVPPLTEEETYRMNLFKGYAGSRSCIECHEKFYKLWSTSSHGLSMQPHTAAFAKAKLTPQANEIIIGKYCYRADISGEAGWVIENGPKGHFPAGSTEHKDEVHPEKIAASTGDSMSDREILIGCCERVGFFWKH